MASNGCLGLTAVQCTGSILMATFSDSGECKIDVGRSCMYIFDTPLIVHSNKHTPMPGTWSNEYGLLKSVGLTLEGDLFRNLSGKDLILRINMQVGWMPYSVIGTTRILYVIISGRMQEIVLSEYVASTNSDIVIAGTNQFLLKNGEHFQPYVWQNTGLNLTIGFSGIDNDTGLIIPYTNIAIERIFDGPLPTPTP
jgi:hypothetical protein